MSQIETILNNALEEALSREFVLEYAKTVTVVGELNYRPINVMISGLSGMGKTAMIRQWGKDHCEEINFVEMDAAMLKPALLEGKKILFSTAEIEALSKPHTVLFVDNYQCLSKEAEEELNKLMDYRKVEEIDGEKTLGNILFTVVAMTVN